MKMIRIITIIGAMLVGAATVHAQGYVWPKAKQTAGYLMTPGQTLFQSHEFDLSIGPSYNLPANVDIGETGGGKGVWGVAGAVDYYPSRFIGAGIDTGLTDTKKPNDLIIDYLDVELDLRLPLDLILGQYGKWISPKFSPGFGKSFQDGSWETQLKAGVAVRFSQHIGAEVDYRRTFEDAGAVNRDANEKNMILGYMTFSF